MRRHGHHRRGGNWRWSQGPLFYGAPWYGDGGSTTVILPDTAIVATAVPADMVPLQVNVPAAAPTKKPSMRTLAIVGAAAAAFYLLLK